MNPGLHDTLASIALQHPGATRVLSRYRLDYCCGGSQTLEEACGRKGIKPAKVIEELSSVPPVLETPATEADLVSILTHVVNKHHSFTRAVMAEIHALADRVVVVHGQAHPELSQLRKVFQEFEADMTLHLRKEEEVLFPYITLLEQDRTQEAPVCFPTVQAPIRMMLHEHDTAGEQLREMRRITQDYALPDGACTKYTILFQRLEELEADVHEHMHIENNILFPRAAALEEQMRGAANGESQ